MSWFFVFYDRMLDKLVDFCMRDAQKSSYVSAKEFEELKKDYKEIYGKEFKQRNQNDV